MNISCKMSFLIILIVMGCGPHIPMSEYPLEKSRSFQASFDKAWDSVLEVVKTLDGIVINKDKSSGLILYKIFDNKSKDHVYVNVYIKNNLASMTSIVYLSPHADYYGKEIDRDFFVLLEQKLKRR